MTPKKCLKRLAYPQKQIGDAINAVKKGMSVLRAAREYGIPRSTLQYKVSGKGKLNTLGRGGFHSALGNDIEQKLVEWIVQCANFGFPISKETLYSGVETLLKEADIQVKYFKDNRPSPKWIYAFLKRHPEVRQKKAEYVNKARGSVTEAKIRAWFTQIQTELGENVHILQESQRVFNMDESGFNLSLQGGVVIAPLNHHAYIESEHSDKETQTTLFAVNAAGDFAPPLTVFKYERMPQQAATCAPTPDWGLGKTESGWMTSECFYEYIANVFLPWVKKQCIQLPVIVFLDGHKSHLSLPLSKFCAEAGIILVSIYPNSTHILQPLDVAVFKPMKANWRRIKTAWRVKHGHEMNKFNVPAALHMIISDQRMRGNIISGFRACGIFPFNADEVDYSKVIKRKEEVLQNDCKETDPEESADAVFLRMLENRIDVSTLHQFKMTRMKNTHWKGDVESKNLFEFWNNAVSLAEGATPMTVNPLLLPDNGCFTEDPVLITSASLLSVDNNSAFSLEDRNEEYASLIEEDDWFISNTNNQNALITIESILSEPTLSTSSISGNDDDIVATQAPKMMSAQLPVSPSSTSSISVKDGCSFIPIKKRRVSEILQSVVKWPEKSKTEKQTRQKEVTPCAVTSKTWIEIKEAKQAEKERTEKEKELRKKEREEKKRILNEEKAQRKIMMEIKKTEKMRKQENVGKKKKIKKEN
ncbi:uncharacterized protein LOC129807685 [Phlebotomus papatasi]|uniref:uncharacterized protein LOC129807685 n=1 Tax=Phlebotomus papatasi TaxID=29031 RepID=UPI0024844388|nr:uncharacterized protein LOC129807685 [Phlebotomus papatasi]